MVWLLTLIIAAGLGYLEGRRRGQGTVRDLEARIFDWLRSEGYVANPDLDCFGNPVQDGP
jgi:hypothetical protein